LSTRTEPIAEPVDWQGTPRYEVLSCLGKGGMGVVYEVFDRERQQVVALKTLLHFDPAALYMFKQEFRTLADVHHTNLVHLYELVMTEDGQVFFTMELVRGTDFRRHVQNARQTSSPPLTATVALRTGQAQRETVRPKGPARVATPAPIAAPMHGDMNRLRPALRQLVAGIHALHTAGKLHRDIKPSNVLVTPEGRVVLLDFGVATELSSRGPVGAGHSGELVGTARYMAPEQVEYRPPMPASDWYSVGVMLYEALVGRPPFVGSLADTLAMKNLMDPAPPSSCVDGVPPDLDALCRALLQRDPTKRPTGDEILRNLGVARSTAPPPAPIGSVDTATAFIGREAQLQTLREAFETTRSGRSVTVRVAGASGMGKSTVAHHVLDELERNGHAVVFRGRAYERESVPYKAVDSIIDALSRHLMRLADDARPLPLPEDLWALGRLFPVLQPVAGVSPPAEQPIDDPQGLRRRAFGALRELLASLAERQPLVLFVDDAQWGDVDSAVLLLELLRPPEAPPMLLLMTYRDNEAQTSPFLAELRDHWPEGAEVRDVTVGPLDVENSQRLALTLLDATDGTSPALSGRGRDLDETAQRTARAVARESRGSPFLIEELVRSNRGAPGAEGETLAVLTLDQMVGERLERLPEPARRLIEIVAVGGRPLPV
jgi:serine/threonine protein kinase